MKNQELIEELNEVLGCLPNDEFYVKNANGLKDSFALELRVKGFGYDLPVPMSAIIASYLEESLEKTIVVSEENVLLFWVEN